MNHDAVFWGVIISVAGSAAVVIWLFYMAYRNATKDKKQINSWREGGGERYSPPFFMGLKVFANRLFEIG